MAIERGPEFFSKCGFFQPLQIKKPLRQLIKLLYAKNSKATDRRTPSGCQQFCARHGPTSHPGSSLMAMNYSAWFGKLTAITVLNATQN
jgi:hypothetical protein